MINQKKVAVVLFNLGGPKDLASVKGFLFNLFYDKAIINLPRPFRWMVAKLISSRREKKAKAIYELIGGKSPILENTQSQADNLQIQLKKFGNFKVYISMRYTKPNSSDLLKQLENYKPDEVILLPLYPQFSTTTTGSSVKDFLAKAKNKYPIKTVCCYPTNNGFIAAYGKLIEEKIENTYLGEYRILFTAHGLPKKIIKAGDPYQWQVEQTAKEINLYLEKKIRDTVICYQSKVGPLEWLGPNTESEIIRGSKEKKRLIIVPLSFVSEHSETLVELDIDYQNLAIKHNCIEYIRIPTVSIQEIFIKSLADIVLDLSTKNVVKDENLVKNDLQNRICPKQFCNCISNQGALNG